MARAAVAAGGLIAVRLRGVAVPRASLRYMGCSPWSAMRLARPDLLRRTPAVVLGDLTLVRPLAMGGVPVVVATHHPNDPTLASRHVGGTLIVPPLRGPTERHAVDALRQAGDDIAQRSGARPLLVYGSDASLAFLYRNREALEARFSLLLNEDPVATDALDKQRFHELAAGRGIRVPRTLAPSARLADAVDFGPTVVVKPRAKHATPPEVRMRLGSAKALVVPSEVLVSEPLFERHRESIVVQEDLSGDVSDLVSFHGFVGSDGRLLASFGGRKIRTHPIERGDSAMIELLDDSELSRVGMEVVERLGIVGPFKLDFIRRPGDGAFVTLEANLRYTLWHYLGAVHGVNLPALAHRYLVEGKRVEAIPTAPRVRWADLDRDFRARRESGLPIAQWFRSITTGPLVYELFAWDDPLPAAHWVGRVVRRRWRAWRVSA